MTQANANLIDQSTLLSYFRWRPVMNRIDDKLAFVIFEVLGVMHVVSTICVMFSYYVTYRPELPTFR